MSRWSFLLALLLTAPGTRPNPPQNTSTKSDALVLTENGRSDYRIVVADAACPATKRGAAELQHFLAEITGVTLPIIPDTEALGTHEIIVGDNAHLRQSGVSLAFDKLGPEGYVVKTAAGRLIIAGGEPRGTLYGVYGLLEDHLGCRWFTAKVSHIPKQPRLEIALLDETRVPALEYRDTFVYDDMDPDWTTRNRMNGSWQLKKEHGGLVKFGNNLFVHTSYTLVPPEKYYAEHPEYYALVNGQRLKEYGQLCFTNDDVVRIVTDELRQRMKADPDAFVFSVSQMDWGNYCQCPKCQELAQKEESQAAPVLQLVNRVAEALADEFPGQAIETLAYQWTRKPPKTMRPRPNVIIRLCSIECCFSHPLDGCDSPANKAFVSDIQGWSKLCQRLWIWNYETSFAHYYRPFPNYAVWDKNIRFYVANGVRGIFTQDNYQSPQGELSELGGYVRAKLLWDPQCDANRAMNEFLEGVYGPAAKPIRAYIDLLLDKVKKDNIHVTLYQPPGVAYLSDEILARAEQLWEQAEAAAAGQPEVLERVRFARLSEDYAVLERAAFKGFFATHNVEHAKFAVVGPKPELVSRLDRFIEIGGRAGVKTLCEGDYPLAAFKKDMEPMFEPRTPATLTPLAAVEPGAVAAGLRYQYFEGQWTQLPDFAGLKPAAEGDVAQVDLKVRQRDNDFGVAFSGYLRVPRDGVYRFQLGSDAGSRLYLGEQLVSDHDGVHAFSVRPGPIGLRAGLHPIRVLYFQHGAGRRLEVAWEGPGLDQHPLGAAELFRKSE